MTCSHKKEYMQIKTNRIVLNCTNKCNLIPVVKTKNHGSNGLKQMLQTFRQHIIMWVKNR